MGLKGTNQGFGKPYNRRIVLETIRLHGPIALGDIARHVGLTVQTVSTITRELEDLGYITGSRNEPRGRGSPSTSLAISPAGGHTIGIHVAQFGLEAALVDLGGTIIATRRKRFDAGNPDATFRAVKVLVDELAALSGRKLLAAGLAMPGPFDVESMSFVGPTTLEGWRGFPVADRLATVAGVPSFIEADSAAAALGERLHGAGRSFRDFYYMYFGVGLGGCMVHEGVAVRGAFRNAGEIGHVAIVPGGEPCACGNVGCVERYVSLEAFYRREPKIGRAAWIAEAAPVFRRAVATIENLFDPETIIVGGMAEESLLADLITAAEPLLNTVSNRRRRAAPRLLRSVIGPEAVLRGAAAVALAGVMSPGAGLLFAPDALRGDRTSTFSRRRVA